MAKSSSELQQTAGFLSGLINQARLAWRLLRDSRVPGWVKLIPIVGALYLLSPIDLIPDLMLPGLGEVDDIVLVLLMLKAFVDMSPPAVVSEHLANLVGKSGQANDAESPSEPYIDAPYRVLDGEDRENK